MFASDADYLEITGSWADLYYSVIACPTNGNYNVDQSPSCVINSTRLDYAQISTPIGIGADLAILGDPSYYDTIINCDGGQSVTNGDANFTPSDTCWSTTNPTQNPTKSPLNDPSISPSKSPSRSPSNNPSKSPTDSPTPKPSDAPYTIGIFYSWTTTKTLWVCMYVQAILQGPHQPQPRLHQNFHLILLHLIHPMDLHQVPLRPPYHRQHYRQQLFHQLHLLRHLPSCPKLLTKDSQHHRMTQLLF